MIRKIQKSVKKPAVVRLGLSGKNLFDGAKAKARAAVKTETARLASEQTQTACPVGGGEKVFEPSKYQAAVFEWVKNGKGNIQVKATAGSGKTSTVVQMLKYIPASKQVIFLAFSKRDATDLQAKVPQNVTASTLNSFGWSLCRNTWKGVRLDDYKTWNILQTDVLDMEDSRQRDFYRQNRAGIGRIVSLLKSYLEGPNVEEGRIRELAYKYGVDLPVNGETAWFIRAVQKTYPIALSVTNFMDFDDQIFQPIHQNVPFPKYDFVVVDEAQDLSQMQTEMVKRLADAGARVVVVGDENQSCYGFRGADVDAMENLKTALNAKELPLSISYRCPKAVIKLAQTLVKEIEPAPWAIEGEVRTDVNEGQLETLLQPTDMVVCRVTAPAVSGCLRMIREGKAARVLGRDIGKNLLALADRIDQRYRDPAMKLLDKVRAYTTEQVMKLAAAERDAEIVSLTDKTDTIIALLSDGVLTVDDLKARVDTVFKDADTASGEYGGVTFSTIHKAKGSEANRVFLLRPDLLPHPMALKSKNPGALKQETNLKFIAWTRTKVSLFIVKHVEAKPQTNKGDGKGETPGAAGVK